jgi:hypothetical protein
MRKDDRMRLAGMIAGISAIVFAIPHFWFWCGISSAYPGDFQDMPRDSALLLVGGLAVLAAVYAIVFTHSSWVRSLPEFIAALPAWVAAVGFTLWGLAYFVLQVQLAFGDATSSGQYFASDTNPNAVWGLYWYSLFIVWGLSLGTAAFCFHGLKRRRNQTGQGVPNPGIVHIRLRGDGAGSSQVRKEEPRQSRTQDMRCCHEN